MDGNLTLYYIYELNIVVDHLSIPDLILIFFSRIFIRQHKGQRIWV